MIVVLCNSIHLDLPDMYLFFFNIASPSSQNVQSYIWDHFFFFFCLKNSLPVFYRIVSW